MRTRAVAQRAATSSCAMPHANGVVRRALASLSTRSSSACDASCRRHGIRCAPCVAAYPSTAQRVRARSRAPVCEMSHSRHTFAAAADVRHNEKNL